MLLGSGVSRSTGIPTGWEVVKDLINKVAHLHQEEAAPDPMSWYTAKFNEEPNYSRLLDALAKTPPERNQILRGYFEADEEERERGIKVPTPAHHAIAGLVSSGHIRVIVTTNFDRLMERALEAAGIDPSVIDSPDKIEGAMPLTHSPCTVIKLHGDYMDIRIKNTPEELAAYDERLNKVLDRVLDEYGLIVCGWSADYDGALEAAISRCLSRRFTTYWAYKDRIGEAAKRLIDLRRAEKVRIESADAFFQEVAEKVAALEEYDRPHPMSVKLAVATEKKFLEEEKYRIRLHDLVMGETDRLLTVMSDKNFPIDIHKVSKEVLIGRMSAYDAVSEILLGLDSSLKCNGTMFMKDLVRRAIAKRLARAVVEPLHRLLDLGWRNAPKVCLLREVLPQQPVRVLVHTSLPARMRAREVELGSQPLRDSRVVRELPAIVRCDGQDVRGQRAEHRHTRCCHFHRTLALNPAQPHEL